MERNFNHQAAKFEEGDKYYYCSGSHKIQGIAMKTAESEQGGRSPKTGPNPAINKSLTCGSGQKSSRKNDEGLPSVHPNHVTTLTEVLQSFLVEVVL